LIQPYTSASKDVIYALGYYERTKPRSQALVQVANSQLGSSEGEATNGGPVEVPPTAMVTKTSIDCIIECETQDTENVEDALHVDLETYKYRFYFNHIYSY